MAVRETSDDSRLTRFIRLGMTAVTVLFLAATVYVGTYIYFRESRAVKHATEAFYRVPDRSLETIYAPIVWLDKKIIGTDVYFIKSQVRAH